MMNDQTDSLCRLAELGVLVAIADGQFVKKEKTTIRAVVAERVQELRPSYSALPEINQTFDRVRRQSISKSEALREAERVCNAIVKYDTEEAEEAAFELALRVVAADGDLKTEEKRILRVIENALFIDAETGSLLREIHLSLCLIDSDTDEEFFDIDPEDHLEERRASARDLYRTWSGRVVLKDLDKQRRAKENVRRLGRLLARYDRESNS